MPRRNTEKHQTSWLRDGHFPNACPSLSLWTIKACVTDGWFPFSKFPTHFRFRAQTNFILKNYHPQMCSSRNLSKFSHLATCLLVFTFNIYHVFFLDFPPPYLFIYFFTRPSLKKFVWESFPTFSFKIGEVAISGTQPKVSSFFLRNKIFQHLWCHSNKL